VAAFRNRRPTFSKNEEWAFLDFLLHERDDHVSIGIDPQAHARLMQRVNIRRFCACRVNPAAEWPA
jgi:hypothetical protein